MVTDKYGSWDTNQGVGAKLSAVLGCSVYLAASICLYPALIYLNTPILYSEPILNIKKFNKLGIDKGKIILNDNGNPFQFKN